MGADRAEELVTEVRRPDAEVLPARGRDRRQRLGSLVPAGPILGHRDADRR